MSRVILLVIACLLCGGWTWAADVVYVGARPSGAEALEAAVETMQTARIDLAVICDSVAARLREIGYIDAAARWREERLEINSGPRYLLASLILDDTLTFAGGGGPFTRSVYDEAANAALELLSNRGHYFARIETDSVLVDGTAVTVYIHAVEGPAVRLSRRVFTGLKRTRPSVVARYLTINDGDTLTDASLQRTESEAGAIPFVQFVPPVVVRPLPGYTEADIDLVFQEKQQVEVSGGVGYMPEEPAYMVWNLDLRLTNLFGDGRSASLLSERIDRRRRRLNLTYGQPLFLAGVGYWDITVATRDFRDDFTEFAAGSRYGLKIRSGGEAGFSLGWRRVEPAVPDSISGFTAYSVQVDASRKTLDIPRNPTSGFAISGSLAWVHRRYDRRASDAQPGRSVYNETHSQLSLTTWLPVTGWLIGQGSIAYRGIETGERELPLSELMLVGGPGTLRGYRTGQFLAQRVALGTVEPRLRFRQGYAFLFTDLAYVNRRVALGDSATRTDELFRAGYGCGLALDDGRRSVKLSLGWGKDSRFSQPNLSVEFSSDL